MIHTNFIGRLAHDPELKKVPKNGEDISVCNVDVAVNRLRGDKVDYITLTAWGKDAERLVEGNQKGSRIAVDGNLQTDIYDKSDGTKGKGYKVVADTIQYLDRKIEKEQEVEKEDLER